MGEFLPFSGQPHPAFLSCWWLGARALLEGVESQFWFLPWLRAESGLLLLVVCFLM